MSVSVTWEPPVYLSGVGNRLTCLEAQFDLYGALNLLIQPDTMYLAKFIPCYTGWAMDNGCFAETKEKPFDGAAFLRKLDFALNQPEGADCLFAVAPDVFHKKTMKGDPVATLKRSRPFFKPIRDLGAPAAFVAQDGMEMMIDRIPWDDFDCLFLGGSTAFKLGYPTRIIHGAPGYTISKEGAVDRRTREYARMIHLARIKGKTLHVGRVNSYARFIWCWALGADTCDGNFFRFGGRRTSSAPKSGSWRRGEHGRSISKARRRRSAWGAFKERRSSFSATRH